MEFEIALWEFGQVDIEVNIEWREFNTIKVASYHTLRKVPGIVLNVVNDCVGNIGDFRSDLRLDGANCLAEVEAPSNSKLRTGRAFNIARRADDIYARADGEIALLGSVFAMDSLVNQS